MGWIISSLLVMVCVLIYTHVVFKGPMKYATAEEYTAGALIGFIFPMILIGIIGGIYTGAEEGKINRGDPIPTACVRDVQSWDIVSAVRDTSVSSSFILGTGGTTRVDRYYVYQVEPEGMMLTDFNAHRTFVVEQDGQPRYERIDWICPRPVADFLWFGDTWDRRNYGRKGTLYVPHGTILREFKM